MKNLIGAIAITACIVGCGQRNQSINEGAGSQNRKEAINESASRQKDRIEANADAAKDQVEANAKAAKQRVEAEKADAKANLSETDRKLQADIRQSLGLTDADTNGRSVQVEIKDGVVTLKGHVTSEQRKMDLESKAKALPGVTRVDNKLDVKN